MAANQKDKQYILAIDTATADIAIALGLTACDIFTVRDISPTDITLLSSRNILASRQANTNLLPAIDELLGHQGIDKSTLSALVCGLGPGSFTGVRIALATAKGIARGLNVPLYGVSTLDALAWQAWAHGFSGRLAVVADAMRNEVYTSRYDLDDHGVMRIDHHSVNKVDDIMQRWTSQWTNMTLAGDGLSKYADAFAKNASGLFEISDESLWHPSGHGLLLTMAANWAELRQYGDAGSLLPIYTRLSDAEENERLRLSQGGQMSPGQVLDVPANGVLEPQRSAVLYRPMALQDTPWVADLEARSFIDAPGTGECWDEAAFRSELYALNRSWWVAWQGQQLAGYIGGWLIDDDMHILDLAVDPSLRRQGVASSLLSHILEDAKALGAATASLEVRKTNYAAIALYTRFGFTQVGTRPAYYSPPVPGGQREDALILKCKIVQQAPYFINNVEKPQPASPEDDDRAGSPTGPAVASQNARPVILAIETSCDETAAAVITGDGQIIANAIASQVDYHARFGGVVPEIASRKHTEAIVGVVDEACEQAKITGWEGLDAIAVTYAPGLIGALVVGVAFAKGLAWATNLPLVRVNHMEGHIYANRLLAVENGPEPEASGSPDEAPRASALYTMGSQPASPFVISLLSGGHTMLVYVHDWAVYKVLGQTLDDAVGEAFDKVAKALGLGYPGGPVISSLALQGSPEAISFPRALMHSNDFNFSLSGLKTAVITWIRNQQEAGIAINPADVAASFQQAVIDVQVSKALAACQQMKVKTFCLGGGVAANQALREAYEQAFSATGIQLLFPPLELCSDNAAMIAAAALDRYNRGLFIQFDSDALAQTDLELDY